MEQSETFPNSSNLEPIGPIFKYGNNFLKFGNKLKTIDFLFFFEKKNNLYLGRLSF